MNTLSIKVEASPGCSCREAIHDMCLLANRLDIRVDCKMNDVTVIAKPLCDPEALCDAWEEEMGSERSYKIVCGQPVIAFQSAKAGEPSV